MLSIIKALNQEYLRRCWLACLAVLGYLVGIPALAAGLTLATGMDVEAAAINSVALHYNGLAVALLGIAAAVLYAQHDQQLQFLGYQRTLPVSTAMLVACKTTQGVFTAVILYWALAFLFDRLFGLVWPLWGPALFMAAAIVFVQASYWSLMDFRIWKLAMVCAVGVLLVYWLDARYVNAGYHEPGSMWTVVSASELVTLLVAVAAGYTVSYFAVARIRCGEAAGMSRIAAMGQWISDVLNSRRNRQFRSPAAAQAWADWRQKGIGMPAVAAVLLLVVLLSLVVRAQLGWSSAVTGLRTLINLSLVILVGMPWVFGILLGQITNIQRGMGFKGFPGTLPVDDVSLARWSFNTANRSFVALVCVCAAVVGIACVWVTAVEGAATVRSIVSSDEIKQYWPQFVPVVDALGAFSMLLFAASPLLVGWIGMVTTMTLVMTGRGWVAFLPLGILEGLAIVAVFLSVLLDREQLVALRFLSALLFGLVCVLGTLVAFVVACQRRYITTRSAGISAIAWLALSSVWGWLWMHLVTSDVWLLLFLGGFLTLAVAPTALAPQALAWNRHR